MFLTTVESCFALRANWPRRLFCGVPASAFTLGYPTTFMTCAGVRDKHLTVEKFQISPFLFSYDSMHLTSEPSGTASWLTVHGKALTCERQSISLPDRNVIGRVPPPAKRWRTDSGFAAHTSNGWTAESVGKCGCHRPKRPTDSDNIERANHCSQARCRAAYMPTLCP